MPLVADLVENHLLRNLTDPDTYAGGVELADRGAVEFDEFSPLHARARVRDGETFIADLRMGPGKLIWSCSEPGGSRGALCRHCVAAAVETWRRAPARADAMTVEEEALVTSGPAPTTQAEPVTAAVSDGEQPAPPEQPDQSASRVLKRSTPQEPVPDPTAEPTPRSAPEPDARLEPDAGHVTGIHAIVFTPAVAEVRAFFRDALGLPNVDAGDGWLIFALPPAELAVHPADVPSHEFYLMSDDIEATLASFERKGVEVRRPVREEAWGSVTEIVLPGGTELAVYQPKHPSSLAQPREQQT
jgi:catechol 2,3-dioxygenase-like lactoylglutathione lyase family enzyme